MTTVGEHVVARLGEWGVRRFYGYPGDGIGGVMSALRKAVDAGDAEFVQVRHEETAAFAACADVKYGGSPIGCAVVTSGPGAVHALNGLYDAKLDHVPVVALLGHTARNAQGSGYYQEVDLLNLVKDVAGAYVAQVSEPSQVRHVVDRAARTALAHRTVTAVVLPSDVLVEDAVVEPPDAHGYAHTSAVPSTTATVPPAAALREAAALLDGCEKVAVLAGAGCLGATSELTAVADRLDAGVAKALLGKAVLDDRLPWVTGAIGLLGTRASWDLMRECDGLLIVGSTMPYSDFYPAPGQARAVQIDIDGANCGLRYDTEVNLVGDAQQTLAALLPLLRTDRDGSWREQVGQWTHAWREQSAARVGARTHELNPEFVVRELSDRLPDDAMLAVDCGTATSHFARDVDLRPGMLASLSGTLLSMGGALPYAIAAKVAHPDRPVFALVGDGAMQMNGVNELITVSRYWRTWADPTFVVLVLNNRDLSFVTWEMRAMVGDVPFAESQDLPDVPYADWAHLLGLGGRRISEPGEVAGLWEEALAADRPFVVDAVVDANVPLIPPHLTLEQVVNTAKSQLEGDPSAPLVIADGLREAVGAPAKGLWHRAKQALGGE
ncbi:thiamine pyrophosphate-requiring protein [Klenkia taihuensis]|uniref:Pyruvate dehydrogenase (Quinone) n=1 Tax=Klenkia taihuensis TaxID=1225127 RepID=A0A1I1NXF4_9ACTN|nr:thiamine pyrophosphate-requiring protein [Klenkia taihuensis]GHE11743.1 thiamine pyrophosphate-requiring protein [Klenkia taihuensis]SFD00168.1 pyruvate dehydrogenase (quinone) [Klenkia taihuensis]